MDCGSAASQQPPPRIRRLPSFVESSSKECGSYQCEEVPTDHHERHGIVEDTAHTHAEARLGSLPGSLQKRIARWKVVEL